MRQNFGELLWAKVVHRPYTTSENSVTGIGNLWRLLIVAGFRENWSNVVESVAQGN